MKKLLFVLCLVVAMSSCSVYTPISFQSLSIDCESEVYVDSVAIDLRFLDSDSRVLNSKMVAFQMKNNTDKRIYIEWENARFIRNHVYFGGDSNESRYHVKADEAVSAGKWSIYRLVGSHSLLNNYYTMSAEDDGTCLLTVPVRFSDGVVVEYYVKFKLLWDQRSTWDYID